LQGMYFFGSVTPGYANRVPIPTVNPNYRLIAGIHSHPNRLTFEAENDPYSTITNPEYMERFSFADARWVLRNRWFPLYLVAPSGAVSRLNPGIPIGEVQGHGAVPLDSPHVTIVIENILRWQRGS